MLKTAILSIGILSSSTNQNANIIQDNLQLQQAKSNLATEKTNFLNSHKLNIKTLEKNLKIIYNHQFKNVKNLKDGRDGYKHHWYGFDLWISDYRGEQINAIITEGGAEIDDIAAILDLFINSGPILVIAAFLAAQWAIVWINTNEGDGVHISVETLTGVPVIVYAHAQ